jgi:hypothetical protein
VKSVHLPIFLITLLLVACTGQATPTLYVPPTGESTPAILTQAPSAADLESGNDILSPQPTPSPDCIPGLVFLSDITIPDGTTVNPGEKLDKRWLVENNGSCNWDRRFSLRLIAGPDMGAQPEIALFPARSGTPAEIRILFTAPPDPGTHRSAWQAQDPQGNLFGDPIFIDVVVPNP